MQAQMGHHTNNHSYKNRHQFKFSSIHLSRVSYSFNYTLSNFRNRHHIFISQANMVLGLSLQTINIRLPRVFGRTRARGTTSSSGGSGSNDHSSYSVTAAALLLASFARITSQFQQLQQRHNVR